MKRTTVFVDETTERDLQALARRQGRPVASLVREALDGYVNREARKGRNRLRFANIGDSGRSDVAERHEELLFRGLRPHGRVESPKDSRPSKKR
jgi:hypothetical protein